MQLLSSLDFFHDISRMRLFAASSVSALVSRLFVGADHGLPWGLLGGDL